MKIVSLEWFEQSLERGMVLDEALYNPTIAVAERGRGAWERREFPSPALGKRTRDPEQSEALNPFRRKLRRSASARMGSQSQALWAGITAAGLDRTHAEGDDWTDDNTAQEDALQEVTPATFVGDVTALDMHASAEVSPAISPSQPLAVSPDDSAGDGVFQGRVILPYGFDEEKVLSSICTVWMLLTTRIE
jgi:DNA replication regulator DPB11